MKFRMTKVVGWLLYGVYVMGILLLPEIGVRVYARYLPPPETKPLYLEGSKSYPRLQQLLRDMPSFGFGYHDYYVYSPRPVSTETINFTSYFGARHSPDSTGLDVAKETVWAFGGSTMQNLETDDQLSLSNQIAVELNQNHVLARVYNFGSGGFQSSLEVTKFQDLLRRVPQSEWPTTAIFYDGFNEAMFGYYFGPATMQQDISLKMKDLVERDYARLMIYTGSEVISRYSAFWRKFVGPRIEMRFYGSQEYPDHKNVSRTVAAYATNVRMTGGLCSHLHIRCLFFLQPLVVTKSPLTSIEQAALDSLDKEYVEFIQDFYKQAAEVLQREEGFHDVSHVLDGVEGSHFFDLGHVSPFSGIPLGRELARRILRSYQPSVSEPHTVSAP